MRVKALLKKDNTPVEGYWINHFDEWAILTDQKEVILIDDLKDYDCYPWLPHDHFCQPKNLPKNLENVIF